jgi:hypothetical protein
MIKTHTMLCIALFSISSILTLCFPTLGMLFNLLVLISLYIVLLFHSRQKESLGPIKSYESHIIQALVLHIKTTDTENLYKDSPLEELVNNHLKQN